MYICINFPKYDIKVECEKWEDSPNLYTLRIGELSIFLTTEQAEKIMDTIDEALHDPSDTYRGKEEKVYQLQRELEELKEGA